MTGKFPENDIDHDNRKREDNRWINLKSATRTENNGNLPMRKDNTSGYRGVSFNDKNKYKKWCCQLSHNGKRVFMKHYPTPEEAALAYNEQAKKYYGDFAFINEIN